MRSNNSELTLYETCGSVIRLLNNGDYPVAVVGLDAILNSLIVNQRKIPDMRKAAALLSWAQGNVLAFVMKDRKDITDANRRKVVLAAYKDARDFSSSPSNKRTLDVIINAVENGISFSVLKQNCEPNFPKDTVDVLRDLLPKLKEIPFPPIPPNTTT